ncbi:BTB/POZ domain-containing protein 8 isoform X2 [Cylas formicarius]|uniref:BTB/POZ domain-containing protein 8 isoform X2 n=1 Tax=Cylas formicarius TaxID=197179 RepID=UPI0029589794|nr:BTB/POZ domain-containing protein 8 isoform X2 [Cylas formicarius]
MNRKHVNGDMDSGLGSDEDRRGRTKEQKQLHNQQLLSGCFIDAATLSDEPAEAVDQRRNDERRQGAIVFQSSIPQFSMLQMSSSMEEREFCSPRSLSNYPDTNTPYNSIVQLEGHEGQDASSKAKMPLGFYVDLSEVPDDPVPPSTSTKKNIFSMVIDFEGPKKDKPNKLSSSFIAHRKNKLNKNSPSVKCNGNKSLSSSVSSVSSLCIAGTSRQVDEYESITANSNKDHVNIEVLSASLVNKLSASSKSSSSDSGKDIIEKSEDEPLGEILILPDTENNNRDVPLVTNGPIDHFENTITEPCEETNQVNDNNKTNEKEDSQLLQNPQTCPQQFVKLSDLECQKPKVEIDFTPRMSRSIPESHWVESPFLMSRSACYRSAPHPIEPEPSETTSDSDSAITNSSTLQPKKAVRRLGTDLLRMFLEEIGPDVVVDVDGRKIKAHKCILSSRCQYFAALLSGNWLEKSGNVISLQGFSYETVYFSLCHIYSGAAHVPDSISLVELSSLADMLGLEGLKEVVEHALKQRHCHNFHKPCAGCCTGVLEVLPLAAAYGLDDLYQKCLHWITLNFVRVWPSRAFASLPRELREKCYQQHVIHMSPDKVLETMANCDKVLITLPALRWAEPVNQLVLQLADACHLYHRQHFASVLASPSFHSLDSGFGFGACQVEDQMLAAAKNLSAEQACRSYARICKMVDQHWSRPFADLLNKIKLQLEQCLVNQSDRLIRSHAWLRLDTALRTRIKELTPTSEPQSRLPRAMPIRNKKLPITHSPMISSSDSSRNSSPATNQLGKTNNNSGSPSLRRSLLLAAKTPQVPPSPSANRKSTLTQPTAASAAKSASCRTVRTAPPSAVVQKNSPRISTNGQIRPSSSHGSMTSSTYSQKSVPSKRSSSSVSRNSSLGKKDMPSNLSFRRPESRSNSPLRPDSRTSSPRKHDSRVTSPIKASVASTVRSASLTPRTVKSAAATLKAKQSTTVTRNSPIVTKIDNRPKPPRRQSSNEEQTKPSVTVPTLQRSGTFVKEEPLVLGKAV